MCCKQRVSFGVTSITDMVVAENGVEFQEPMLIGQYLSMKAPDAEAAWCKSCYGYMGFAMLIEEGSDLVVTLNDGSDYDSPAKIIIGGVPTHRPPHVS